MDNIDKALLELSEKELLILNLRSQADVLHRLKRLENIASLIQKHLLPNNADDFYKGTGNTCGTFLEMLAFASKINCGDLGDNSEAGNIVSNTIKEIDWYKERFKDVH